MSAHTYIIGRSGTGKSTLLASLMARDDNFALLDPHGDLANQVADACDPNRTIYFHHSCPLGFNPLDRAAMEAGVSDRLRVARRTGRSGPRSKGAHTMKTETFEGATLEKAEKKKARWLSAHNGVTVRATRTNYAATGPDQRYAKIMFRPSIEVDYDDSN